MPAIALLSGTASRSRARRALRLRSPRETPLRSDTDVLLLRVGSEPEQRIRRTSSRLRPTRKTTYYAASAHSPAGNIVAEAIPLDAPAAPGGRPAGERDRRLLGELARSLALVAGYTAGNQDAFLRNDMAVDATRQRLREIALACARLSGDLKARHPGVRWRALTGLPAVLGHGPYPAWEISRNHLTQLRA